MADSEPTSNLGKRPREDEEVENGGRVPDLPPPGDEDSSDEDIGPMPVLEGESGENGVKGKKKKRTVLAHERVYLDHLPDSDRYYKSFMHRDVVNYAVSTKTNFVITTSVDGHVKLWKKQERGIEFVKHFRASIKGIVAVSVSDDGKLFATVSEGGEGRVFDVVNFDMINIFKFDYAPKTCAWIHKPGDGFSLLAVSDLDSPTIRIYDGRGDGKPLHELSKIHRAPVQVIAYNSKYDCVVSADEDGFVEYWQPSEPWGLPSIPGLWQFKSQTDLFQFKKTRSIATCITFSPSLTHFAVLALPSRAVHVFNFLTAKLTRTYDESLTAITEMQQAGTAVYQLEDMDFGRRLAIERELEREQSGPRGALRSANAVWDESGHFLLYPTMLGIKVVNTVTNKVVRVLGKEENLRFLNLALYQGAPAKKGLTTLAMAASANPLLQEKAVRDPHLFSTAYKKSRFYLFGKGGEEAKSGDRDVFNERPTREDQQLALPTAAVKAALATSCTIHTSMGDIKLKLFPDIAPKAVENFVQHAKSGYYNGIIFHRVIRKFMLQTGDPLGDGTGGESIWGSHFEDEFSTKARFDRPYTLAMANSGPRTNGSQFFVTTVPCPWLNDKHTVFGRAIGGLDIIHDIEGVKVDKNDKPYEEIRMMSITVD